MNTYTHSQSVERYCHPGIPLDAKWYGTIISKMFLKGLDMDKQRNICGFANTSIYRLERQLDIANYICVCFQIRRGRRCGWPSE